MKHNKHIFLTRAQFYVRLLRNFLLATSLMVISLLFGSLGYHFTEGMSWIDSTLNAAMILTGMGPVTELSTHTGKIFAIVYALFSGVVFLSVAAVLLAPLVHRVLRHFHLEAEERAGRQ